MTEASVAVHADPDLLAQAVAARLVVKLLDAQAERGQASVVLTGGRIAAAGYRAVGQLPARDAVREAYAYARDHEDEVRAKIPTFTEIKPEVAAKITLTGLRDEVSRQAAEKLADYARRDGLITTTPDLDELILR